MIIEQFNAVHICVLLAGVLLTLGIWLALRKASDTVKYRVMLIIEIFNLFLYVFREIILDSREGWFNIFNCLPLYLCNFSLVINLVALIFKNKLLYHYSYFIASIGAIMALILPSRAFIGEGCDIFDVKIFTFYLQHILVANCGILLYALGFFKLEIKRTALSNLFLFGFAIIAHVANVLIINNGLGTPNYMFTVTPDGIPLLTNFWDLCGGASVADPYAVRPFAEWFTGAQLWYLAPCLCILAVTDVLLAMPVKVAHAVTKRRGKKQNIEILRTDLH